MPTCSSPSRATPTSATPSSSTTTGRPHVDALCAGFVLGEADAADLGVGEGDAGLGPIAGAGAGLAEDVVGRDAGVVHGHVGEAAAHDIADGPHAGRTLHAQVVVDG